MSKLGLLTIGQSPRSDITPTFENILGDSVDIIEGGALDSLTESEIKRIQPIQNETTYVSKLKNGDSTKISKKKLLPLLQQELNKLEQKVELTVMLCTGNFPSITSTKPILYPDDILVHNIKAILKNGKLGLLIPLEKQRDNLLKKWERIDLPIVVESASPYEKVDIKKTAARLKREGATMIVLDCMGYNLEHKTEVRKSTNLPTILSKSLTASIVKEYLI